MVGTEMEGWREIGEVKGGEGKEWIKNNRTKTEEMRCSSLYVCTMVVA